MQYPRTIMVLIRNKNRRERVDFWFDSVAPLTGDGIYKRVEKDGPTRHAILINPRGFEHQVRKLSASAS